MHQIKYKRLWVNIRFNPKYWMFDIGFSGNDFFFQVGPVNFIVWGIT